MSSGGTSVPLGAFGFARKIALGLAAMSASAGSDQFFSHGTAWYFASSSCARIGYSEYVGSGAASTPPAPTNVRVAIVSRSSLPLPQRIQSFGTPSTFEALARNGSPDGLG